MTSTTLTDCVYNIPTHLVPAYRGRRVIVRTREPGELVNAFSDSDLDNLVYIQILSLHAEVDALAQGGYGIPVELVMVNPETEFAKLYRHAKLLDKRPVRVSIPVKRGFSKAVKVATSLHFAVKLKVGQPDPDVVAELTEVLNFFLHHSLVEQPIEYFNTLLLAMYHQEPLTLWEIQEEDPAYVRLITDEGAEMLSRLPDGEGAPAVRGDFVQAFKQELLTAQGECSECEFWENCGGYFKLPRRDYACDGVKVIFRALKSAAEEMKSDLAAYDRLKGESQP